MLKVLFDSYNYVIYLGPFNQPVNLWTTSGEPLSYLLALTINYPSERKIQSYQWGSTLPKVQSVPYLPLNGT